MEYETPICIMGLLSAALASQCIIFSRSAIGFSFYGVRRSESRHRRLQQQPVAQLLRDEREPGERASHSVRQPETSWSADRRHEPLQSLQSAVCRCKYRLAEFHALYGFLATALCRATANPEVVGDYFSFRGMPRSPFPRTLLSSSL